MAGEPTNRTTRKRARTIAEESRRYLIGAGVPGLVRSEQRIEGIREFTITAVGNSRYEPKKINTRRPHVLVIRNTKGHSVEQTTVTMEMHTFALLLAAYVNQNPGALAPEKE